MLHVGYILTALIVLSATVVAVVAKNVVRAAVALRWRPFFPAPRSLCGRL